MPSFLVEFFSEEIPARMQAQAASYLRTAFLAALKEAGLAHENARSFVTPRRLALLVTGIPALQPDATLEKKGPKTGAPAAAIEGFLRATGLPLEKLEKRMVGKDETYFAVVHNKGQQTARLLKPLVEKIAGDFPWPKSMRWGAGETRWVRPLHSILCLFDAQVVPVEFAGLTASNTTYGHRFLAPAAITVDRPEEYQAKLKAAYVVADAEERKAQIEKDAEALAAQHGLNVKHDDGLLAEVTGLVEWPVVLMGSIDAQFMDLPPEVLISEMRAHQKYFALLDKSYTFCNKFLITANNITTDAGKAVIAGNERVLRARLSDGRFFWDQDRKKPLSEWAKGLEGVTFHAKIGTMAEKVERVTALAVKLAEYVPWNKKGGQKADPALSASHREGQQAEAGDSYKKLLERTAQLCKADLVTGMVGEFPELQGVMGRYYALAQNEDASVADAIRDHYLPLGPDSPVPTQPVSICIALADKIDTLREMFRISEQPTGSKDPFALRRAMLGIIRIIRSNNIRLPLSDFFIIENKEIQTLRFFVADRLKVQLKDEGITDGVIKAVMAKGDDDLVRVVSKAKALQEFLKTEDGVNLLVAYKRAANIVEQAEKKDGIKYESQIRPALMDNVYEQNVADVLSETREVMQKLREAGNFVEMMRIVANLRNPIDAFFTHVLINDENKDLRTNRLGMLAWIRDVFNEIADFSLIEG